MTAVRRKGARTILKVRADPEPLRPLLRETIQRGLLPRPDLDIFPGRKDIIDNLRKTARRLAA